MKVDAKTIAAFFAAAEDREADLRELDAFIQQTTGIEPVLYDGMSITMLAYGLYHYKSRSGREGDWPVISLANQKNYISLYVCAVKDGKYLAEIYGKKLGKVSTGRSCVRFKKFDDLVLPEVKNILMEAAEWYRQQQGKVVEV